MSINQLRAFHYVALAGGFSSAARELSTSQSALSQQVGQLETSSQINLFHRKARGVTLSEEGRSLFEITQRLFAAELEARAFLKRDSAGHLRVIADGAVLVLPILALLRDARPKMSFSLAVENSDRVVERILDFAADVGISARPVDDPRIVRMPLLSMSIGLSVPAGHELAETGGVPMAALAGRRFVIREKGSLTREVFERNVADHGVRLGPVLEIATREGVREAVAAGFGIGVVAGPEFGHDARLRFVPILDTVHRVDEWVVCLADRRHLSLVDGFFAAAAAHAEGSRDDRR
jgi:aminoethylphosphonate catabolism LysR family transcriptional regulator